MDYYQKSLDAKLKSLGPDHISLAYAYNNIGVISDRAGHFDKALNNHLKALIIREQVYGTWHEEVASSYNNLGAVWQAKKISDRH